MYVLWAATSWTFILDLHSATSYSNIWGHAMRISLPLIFFMFYIFLCVFLVFVCDIAVLVRELYQGVFLTSFELKEQLSGSSQS